MSDTATYLYAVTWPVPADRIAALRGIGGVPVRLLSMGDLACAVSTVSLDEFGTEAFARNLEKLAWLERVAREHDAVVQALAGLTTVVPLRLGAVRHLGRGAAFQKPGGNHVLPFRCPPSGDTVAP